MEHAALDHAAVGVWAGSTPLALTPHSTAEFDYTRQVTIKGTVREVQWTNPHS